MRKFALVTLLGFGLSLAASVPALAQSWRPISWQQSQVIVQDVTQAMYLHESFQSMRWWEGRIVQGGYPVLTDELSQYVAGSYDFSNAVQAYGSRAVIENVYRTLFRRPAGQAGYNAWALYLDRGNYDAFVFGVLASVEFQRNYGIYLQR